MFKYSLYTLLTAALLNCSISNAEQIIVTNQTGDENLVITWRTVDRIKDQQTPLPLTKLSVGENSIQIPASATAFGVKANYRDSLLKFSGYTSITPGKSYLLEKGKWFLEGDGPGFVRRVTPLTITRAD